MASSENTKNVWKTLGARRTTWLLLGLAFFVAGVSCARKLPSVDRPLVVIVPKPGSEAGAATSVGLAEWVGLELRSRFGARLRVAAVPEVVNALGLDSLSSLAFVRRALERVRASAVAFCTAPSPDSLVWSVEVGGKPVAQGQANGSGASELFAALGRQLGEPDIPSDVQCPAPGILHRVGQLLLGRVESPAKVALAPDSAGGALLGVARFTYFLNRVLENRVRHEDVTEPLYEAGEVLRTQWYDTSSTEWKLWRGAYFTVAQRWSQAERWLAAAWKANPADGRVAYWLSHMHPSRLQALGLGGTEAALKLVIELNPLLFEARLQLAELYFGNRRFREEERVLKRLLAINPSHVEALMKLGRLYMTENKVPEVLETYKRVIDLDPANADAYYNLGIVYFGTGDLRDAQKLFQRAVELTDHPEAHLYLGFLYEKLGKRDSAITEYRKRIRLRKGPDDQYANEARKRLWELLHSGDAETSAH